MGPDTECLELARKILANHPDLGELEIDLAYALQAAKEAWLEAQGVR